MQFLCQVEFLNKYSDDSIAIENQTWHCHSQSFRIPNSELVLLVFYPQAHEGDEGNGLRGVHDGAVKFTAQKGNAVDTVAAKINVAQCGAGEVGAGEVTLVEGGMFHTAFVHRTGVHVAADKFHIGKTRLREIRKAAARGVKQHVVDDAVGEIDAGNAAGDEFGADKGTLAHVNEGKVAVLEDTVGKTHTDKGTVAKFAVDKHTVGNIHIGDGQSVDGFVKKMEAVDIGFLNIRPNHHVQR